MAKTSKAPNFEKDLERLEAIVSALEEGGLSLDDSLKRFEEGIGLARRCEKALATAEKRIEVLTQKASGEVEAVPFEDGSGEGESGEGETKPEDEASGDSDQDEDEEEDEPPGVDPEPVDGGSLLF